MNTLVDECAKMLIKECRQFISTDYDLHKFLYVNRLPFSIQNCFYFPLPELIDTMNGSLVEALFMKFIQSIRRKIIQNLFSQLLMMNGQGITITQDFLCTPQNFLNWCCRKLNECQEKRLDMDFNFLYIPVEFYYQNCNSNQYDPDYISRFLKESKIKTGLCSDEMITSLFFLSMPTLVLDDFVIKNNFLYGRYVFFYDYCGILQTTPTRKDINTLNEQLLTFVDPTKQPAFVVGKEKILL